MTTAIETIALMCTKEDGVYHHVYNLFKLSQPALDDLMNKLHVRHVPSQWNGYLTLVGYEPTRVALGRTVYSFLDEHENLVVHMCEKDYFNQNKKGVIREGRVGGSWELKPCAGTYFLHWSGPGGDA